MANSTSQSTKGNLWRLLRYVKPYRRSYIIAVILGLIKMLAPIAVPIMFGEAIDILHGVKAGTVTPEAAWSKLLSFFAIGCTIAIVNPIPTYLRSIIGARAGQRVIKDIRCELYAHVQKLSHSFFDQSRSGSLTSRIISDVQTIQPFIVKALIQVWLSVGVVTVILGYFFYRSWILGLLSLALIPVQVLVIRIIGHKVKRVSKRIRKRLAWLYGNTQEKLAATTVVKAFTQEDGEVQRFSDDSEALMDMGIERARLSGINQACVTTLNMLAPLLVILIGGHLVLFNADLLSVGLLVQFVMIQGRLYQPFTMLSETQIVIADALGSTDRIFEIFDTEPEVSNRPGAVRAGKLEGELRFENVHFSYPVGDGRKTIRGLDLFAPAKSTVALVGPSGGGKSTIGNLLNRFYEVDNGSVAVDGRDIRDYTVYSLRYQIGLVPQEPILFSGTIQENILYGSPGSTDKEVIRAARNSYALDFIEAMPDGFDSVIGERGLTLSGGQKQRLAIARAFLKDPSILILDEATSSLDTESEHYIQEALKLLMQGRTTLVIAHRLSTIKNADQIAVIDNGKVVENGTHEELLETHGVYSSLYQHQVPNNETLLA